MELPSRKRKSLSRGSDWSAAGSPGSCTRPWSGQVGSRDPDSEPVVPGELVGVDRRGYDASDIKNSHRTS